MSLEAGTKLGHYEVQRPIGKGGMGEVYGAIDSRLGRTVAIKILAAGHRDDDGRLGRFEQEARTVGALNHPNLLTLYDVGRHDGSPYIVTELLTGKTLRAVLSADGKLPLAEALHIAANIARGLAAAHAIDIIHRDIKPDNLFITEDGRIKILDFGVAKLHRAPDDKAATPDNAALRETALDTPHTVTGTVIGTPGYMAPEQLQGAAIDKRTDVFALGVVLYEMLTARRPFAADTPIEESYAILKQPPPPLEGRVPAAVERLIKRCLEKKPDARFQSASDLAFALAALDLDTSGRRPATAFPKPSAPAAAPKPTAAPARTRWLVVAGIATALVAAVWIGRASKSDVVQATPAPSLPATQWPSLLDAGPLYRRITYELGNPWNARFLPGERSVVYSQMRDGKFHIFKSDLDSPYVRPVREGLLYDVSRRGEYLTVPQSGGELQRGFEGSAPRTIASDVVGASWGPDDTIAILRRMAGGRAIEYPLGTKIVQSATLIGFMRVSRAGNHIAYCDCNIDEGRGRVVIVDRTGRVVARSAVHEAVLGIDWSTTDAEVWFATPSHDASTNGFHAVDLQGRERMLLRTRVYPALFQIAERRILMAPHENRIRQRVMKRGEQPRDAGWYDGSVVQGLSRDGTAAAFVEGSGTGGKAGVYAAFLRTGDDAPVQLGNAYRLAVLPDAGSVIALDGERKPLKQIYVRSATPRELPRGPIERFAVDDELEIAWSAPRIAFRGATAGQPMRLWVQDITIGDPRPIGPAVAPAGRHPISHDGAWVATRDAAGVRLYATTGTGERVVARPGDEPIGFSADGKALFVQRSGFPYTLDRVELGSGQRTEWMSIVTGDVTPHYFTVRLDATGATASYSYATSPSDLYLIEPAK